MRCHRPPIFSTVIAVAAVSLFAAGCGGGSSTTPTTTMQNEALAFSHCMHSHGVPKFPDPNTSGQIPKEQIIALGPSSPQFNAAQRACAQLWPYGRSSAQSPAQGQPHTAAMLAFARCLRSHGLTNFPDPTSSGQVTHEMVASAGINLHQPAVLRAGDACVSVTHGAITKAIVARFVAGQ